MNRVVRNMFILTGVILVLALVGFFDTGVLIETFSIVDANTNVSFEDGEPVDILKELENSFLVRKNNQAYEIPFEKVLRISKTTQRYIALGNGKFLTEPNGKIMRSFEKGEEFQVLKMESPYGYFEDSGKNKGYIYMPELEIIAENISSRGVSLVDEELINSENKFFIEKGKILNIKNYLAGQFIIEGDNKIDYLVSSSKIRLISKNEAEELVSRGNATQRSSNVEKIIKAAHEQLGKPYVYGSAGPNSFDCSGLTHYLYKNVLGIKLNRVAADIRSNGVSVKSSELLPGDLVLLNTYGKGISHVGIYIGEGKFIHASSGNKMKVIISELWNGWYKGKLIECRRVIFD